MSELNKILGRDFLIGFFLPSLYLFISSHFLFEEAGIKASWLDFNTEDPLKDSIFALEVFVFGILLQSINREIFRLSEGYWWRPFAEKVSYFEKKRFQKLNGEIKRLKDEKELCRLSSTAFAYRLQYNKLSEEMAFGFPREEQILPTSFGNIVRAYEDYPRRVYGFESINGWSRIQILFSKQTNEVMSRARSRLDMWLNLSFVTALLMLEIAIVDWKRNLHLPAWLFFLCLLFIFLAYIRARGAAKGYGERVKATFDIYLPQLAKKLGFELSDDISKNMEFWKAFSPDIS